MEKRLGKLISNLDLQIRKHKSLSSMLSKKLYAAVSQDWKKLQELVEESNPLLAQIRSLEDERVKIVNEIAGDGSISISQLVSMFETDKNDILVRKANELSRIVKEIESLVVQIDTLLKVSLEVIDYTVALLSGNGSSGVLYGTGGREEKSERNIYPLVLNIKA